MKKPPKKVQAVEIFKHAETFYKSIDQLHKTDRNVIAAVSMPICVLSAFASELYLKCLVCDETGKMARGHHLHDLFRKLSSPTQRLLERLWDQQNATREAILRKIDAQNEKPIPRDLRSCLKAGNKSFEQIRYAYERGEDFVFVLSDFPTVLRQALLNVRPDWFKDALPASQMVNIKFDVSDTILGSDILFHDETNVRLGPEQTNKKIFRDLRTGNLFDTREMISNLLIKTNTRKQDLVKSAAIAEAIVKGICVGKPDLNISFTPGSFDFCFGDKPRDIKRIVFDVEMTVRPKKNG
jgi:HEPN domain-containing protein